MLTRSETLEELFPPESEAPKLGKYKIGKLQIEITQGRKSDNDRLFKYDIKSAITYEELAIITSLKAHNEDRIYPPEEGYEGDNRFWKYLFTACDEGIDAAKRYD